MLTWLWDDLNPFYKEEDIKIITCLETVNVYKAQFFNLAFSFITVGSEDGIWQDKGEGESMSE